MSLQSMVSPINFSRSLMDTYDLSPNLSIVDCTLRDGEQQAGVAFTKDEKIQIAHRLDEIGIPEIEAGMPVASKDDRDAIYQIVQNGIKAKLTALARPIKSDIDLLSECGVDCATISIPIGDLQRKYKLKWGEEEYIQNLLEITEYAKSKNLYVNVSPYDTTRVDMAFFSRVLQEIKNSDTIDRCRLVDTVGASTPNTIKYFVKFMKNRLGKIPIEVHCHDDFGLATACTLAGAEAGAEFLSTTMYGIGERAGNAATEEVLVSLKYLYDIDLRVNLRELTDVANLVKDISHVDFQQHKAVVGKHAFTHETGMVVAGVLENPFVAEAYKPENVGQKREILIGKKSGRKSIEYKLRELNIQLGENRISELLNMVKDFSIKHKRTLYDEEFVRMIKNLE